MHAKEYENSVSNVFVLKSEKNGTRVNHFQLLPDLALYTTEIDYFGIFKTKQSIFQARTPRMLPVFKRQKLFCESTNFKIYSVKTKTTKWLN
jgi:hypothetical protein